LKDKGITTNRGMVKRTFLEKGMSYVSELALMNTEDLVKILEFNSQNGINLYRMSSDIFPWCSEYELKDLPDYDKIEENLKIAGELAKRTDQRLTFHPSPYCVIASLREDVVEKSFKELRQHSEIMDIMGLERSHRYPINIHINTAKPTKEEAAKRFIESYSKLDEGVKARLVLENDDKPSQFTPTDLYNMVHLECGIPLTFDYLHHKCNPDSLSQEEALELCLSSWPVNITPITHFSDSRKLYEDNNSRENAHTDWIWSKIETYDKKFDIELEVKMKDLALIKYRESCQILKS
jgi:UV DNA damage endonuclease